METRTQIKEMKEKFTLSPCSSVPVANTTFLCLSVCQRLIASAKTAVYKWPMCGTEIKKSLDINQRLDDGHKNENCMIRGKAKRIDELTVRRLYKYFIIW